ncbi:hypothetical protein KOR42_45580 [Thalassoglobus neptunius]|uniref:Uncharacterized protein n=1 Tax=Thalassoglobus neptunius TaxID=1938619 RepID=A0A5C5VWN3_9PLAN|nr:hypothetical protein [Thalassoglobus neptunius]TWT43028.1 hypothetical protein KOR42_45580 [Thalassoglobus neptunius]
MHPSNFAFLLGTLTASATTLLTMASGHQPETTLWRVSISSLVIGSLTYIVATAIQEWTFNDDDPLD